MSNHDCNDLPPNWVCLVSKSKKGKKYFFNTQTGVSTWKKPISEDPSTEKDRSVTSSKKRRHKSRKRKSNTDAEQNDTSSKKKKHRSDSSKASKEQGLPKEKAKYQAETSATGSGSKACDKISNSSGMSLGNKKSQSDIHVKSNGTRTSSIQAHPERPVLKAQRKEYKSSSSRSRKTLSDSGDSNPLPQTRSNSSHSKSAEGGKTLAEPPVEKEKECASSVNTSKASSLPDANKSSHSNSSETSNKSCSQVVKPVLNQEKVLKAIPPLLPLMKKQDSQSQGTERSDPPTQTHSNQHKKHVVTSLSAPATGLNTQPLMKSSQAVSFPNKATTASFPSGHTSQRNNSLRGGQVVSSTNNEKKTLVTAQSQKIPPKEVSVQKPKTNLKFTQDQIEGIVKRASKLVPQRSETSTSNQALLKCAKNDSTLRSYNNNSSNYTIPKGITTTHNNNSSNYTIPKGITTTHNNNSSNYTIPKGVTTTHNNNSSNYTIPKGITTTHNNNSSNYTLPKGITTTHNNNSSNYTIPKSITTTQTPRNVPKPNNIPLNTSMPVNHLINYQVPPPYNVKSSHLQTNVEINGNFIPGSETHNVSLLHGNPPMGPSDTAQVQDLFPTDKLYFQPLDNQILLPASNFDNSSSSSFFCQDAYHDTLVPIDLGSAVVESTRAIEDMEVDSDGTDESIHSLVLVIDTNVLIDSLPFLAKLIKATVQSYGSPTFVLPWVVIQELDRLKVPRKNPNSSNPNLHLQAAAAVRFIHSHLVAKNPHVKGQTPQEAYEKTDLPIEMNDDKILHCCLQYQKKFPSCCLCLMTRDINLRNKSVIMGIDATDDKNLFSFLNVPNPLKTSLLNPVMKLVKDHILSTPNRSTENAANPGAFKETINTNLARKKSMEDTQMLDASQVVSNTNFNGFKGSRTENPPQRMEAVEKNCAPRNINQDVRMIPTLQRTPSNTLPVGNCNISNGISSHTSAGTEMPSQPQALTPEETSQVFAKFESVWKLVFDVKSELERILKEGKTGPRYDEGMRMLKTMSTLVPQLCSSFGSCLTLSPLIVQNHPAKFDDLCSALNFFFGMSGVENKDPSPPIRSDYLMLYFKESKNRVLLRSGLEQMSNFSTEYLNLMSSVS